MNKPLPPLRNPKTPEVFEGLISLVEDQERRISELEVLAKTLRQSMVIKGGGVDHGELSGLSDDADHPFSLAQALIFGAGPDYGQANNRNLMFMSDDGIQQISQNIRNLMFIGQKEDDQGHGHPYALATHTHTGMALIATGYYVGNGSEKAITHGLGATPKWVMVMKMSFTATLTKYNAGWSHSDNNGGWNCVYTVDPGNGVSVHRPAYLTATAMNSTEFYVPLELSDNFVSFTWIALT